MQANASSADDRAADSRAGLFVRYQRLPTFSEYLEMVPQNRELFETRLGEIRIPPDDLLFFVTYPQAVRMVVVVADDSPSTLVVLPVIAHVAAQSKRLDLRVVREPDAAALLARLTGDPQAGRTLAERSLPRLLVLDKQGQVQAAWGPHPAGIESYSADGDSEQPLQPQDNTDSPPKQRERLIQEMRLWYNSGLDKQCVAELHTLLAALLPEQDAGETAS